MASKQVTDRQKSATAVVAIADAQGATLAAAAGKVLGDEEGVRNLVASMTRGLAASIDTLIAADQAHESELADDAKVRDARDAASSALTALVVDLREVVTGLYGATSAGQIFPGPAPQDPVVLERFAGEVAENLARVQLPPSRVAGATLNTAELSQGLRAAQATLRDQLAAVSRELREAQDTLAKKNRAFEEHDRIFSGAATALSGLFTLAGELELARKVRPSLRRPGQTEEQAEEGQAAAQ